MGAGFARAGKAEGKLLDVQYVFRQGTDATESLLINPCSLIDRRLGVAANVGALNGTPRLSGPVRRMSVPDRPVVDNQGACWAACQYLVFVVCSRGLHGIVRNRGPGVRARHKTS